MGRRNLEPSGELSQLLRPPFSSEVVFSGRAGGTLPGYGTVEGPVRVEWRTSQCDFELSLEGDSRFERSSNEKAVVPGRLVPSESLGSLVGEVVGCPFELTRCGLTTFPLVGPGTIKGRGHLRVGVAPSVADTGYGCWILKDCSLDLWPCGTRYSDEWRADSLDLELHEGPLRITRMDDTYARLVSLSGGHPFGGDERRLRKFLVLVGFLLGRPIWPVKRELFSPTGKLLFSEYFTSPRRANSGISYTPLPIRYSMYGNSVLERLPEICQQTWAAYERLDRGVFFQEAVAYLHSAERAAIEARFGVFAVGFETLSSSFSRVLGGDASQAHTYLPTARFRKLVRPIVKLFRESFREELSADDLAAMEGKLRGINNRAMADRAREMLSRLGLRLNQDEIDVLRLRNSAIHEGVLTRNRDALNYQEIIDKEAIFRTLLHKVLLRLVGYIGPIVDYATHGSPAVDLTMAPEVSVGAPVSRPENGAS